MEGSASVFKLHYEELLRKDKEISDLQVGAAWLAGGRTRESRVGVQLGGGWCRAGGCRLALCYARLGPRMRQCAARSDGSCQPHA